MSDVLFLIIRHVENEDHNKVWIESYKSIRKYYPDNPIKIIDNDSDYRYISTDIELINCEVITAEFPETRLYSPFYELMKLDFDRAVVIHDTVLFRSFVDFTTFTLIKFLWHFETHLYDNRALEMGQLGALTNNTELINIYRSNDWYGCMGCLTVIDKKCLDLFESQFSFSVLRHKIKCQADAIAFERVLAVLAYAVKPSIKHDISYLGDIKNIDWGVTYDTYTANPHVVRETPILKLFAARK
jgi:hypothetical protein